MDSPSDPTPVGARQKFARLRNTIDTLPTGHPLRVSARTFALGASLSLGPALLSVLRARLKSKRGPPLVAVLTKHLGPTGFPFAMTVAVGGGKLLSHVVQSWIEDPPLASKVLGVHPYIQRLLDWVRSLGADKRDFVLNFLSSLASIALLQAGYRNRRLRRRMTDIDLPMTVPEGTFDRRLSPTLDLTLLFCVRAGDALVQHIFSVIYDRSVVHDPTMPTPGSSERSKTRWMHKATGRLDAFAFWLSSCRIMWCFFYDPTRLPASYVKWINALAEIDPRLVNALSAIHKGTFSYKKGTVPIDNPKLTTGLAADLGCPPEWGNPALLSAFGGKSVTARNAALGFRRDVGGLPCEIVHGGVNMHSCTANALRRGGRAFLKALLIYLPVHFLPLIFVSPRSLLDLKSILPRVISLIRSSAFLSTFVSSIWFSVCLTRTLLLARLFPGISHDFFDGAFGCVFAGCLACGSSIWIESARRRGEMALYVLPRAIRASLPLAWSRNRSSIAKVAERLFFATSLAYLLSAAMHQTDSLRGLTRATITFIMQGRLCKKEPPPTVPTSNGVVDENRHKKVNGFVSH